MKTNPHDIADALVTANGRLVTGGLTKREYFAARALQGLLANITDLKEDARQNTSKYAVSQADALIAALNKVSEQDKS